MFETTWAIVIAVALQSAGGAPSQAPSVPAPTGTAASSEAWPDHRPLTRLFPNLLRDLVALPSANSGVVLAGGGAAALGTHEADARLDNWSANAGTSSYAAAGRVLGDGWIQSGGAIATYAIGKLADRPQAIHLGGDLIRAQALNAVVTTVLKLSIDRARPSGGNHAFPSGHTSATFASAAVLQAHYGWRIGLAGYAAAGFVGWSRTRERHHWLSDAAFGAAVGIVSGRTVAARHQRRAFVIVPTPTKGGAAVTVMVMR